MLLECYTQYVSKFGKLSSGDKTGKGHFSFLYPTRAMSRSIQSMTRLLSFQMLASLCSKSFKLGFTNMWTENSRGTGWVSEMHRNQRWNCQHSLDHRERKGIPEKKKYTSASLTMQKTLTVFSSIQLVVSNSSRLHGLQHARLPDCQSLLKHMSIQ